MQSFERHPHMHFHIVRESWNVCIHLIHMVRHVPIHVRPVADRHLTLSLYAKESGLSPLSHAAEKNVDEERPSVRPGKKKKTHNTPLLKSFFLSFFHFFCEENE